MTLKNFVKLKLFNSCLEKVFFVKHSEPAAYNSSTDFWLFCDRIDVLNLDKSLHVIFKHAGKELLQFTATEVFKDFFPFWWLGKFSEVRSHITAQNTQGCRLSNTVSTHETKNLASSRNWKSVQLEAIGTISMGDLRLEPLGEIDNFDSLERTPFDAHTTANTEVL